MTTDPNSAADTGLPNDDARLKEVFSIVNDIEQHIGRCGDLIRGAQFAISGAFGPCDKEMREAIESILEAAEARNSEASINLVALYVLTKGSANHV